MNPAWTALRETDLKSFLTRHSDLLLAAIVVGVVAMMIIPLPTFLLDILITTNIALAVILLLVGIYVANALRIAAFPSILLITTLYRLGLNVSSTRLILLQADAGEVIYSFGNFVVAGSIVVGAVVFLILTIIQFVVIAKGSERVAEVGARFTLDAMPGKQMAIDADVRAGAIDMDEARRRRATLQRESQLYGSMDGAMKFVKGDAIAGILITMINIVGGLAIGVLQRGMTLGEAAQLYTLLTVGDGLVSQIPALLISTAAGIVVTRVASEDEGSHLGRDIGEQLLRQQRAIGIAAALLILLAVVPGLPTLPFLLLGFLAAGVVWRIHMQDKQRQRAEGGDALNPTHDAASTSEVSPLAPVSLELGSALSAYVEATSHGGRLMRELVPGLRELIYRELGVIVPSVHVRAAGDELAAEGYRILLADVPMGQGHISSDALLVVAPPEKLSELLHLPLAAFERVAVTGIETPVYRVPCATRLTITQAGIQAIDPPTQIVLHLGQVLRTYAFELLGIQETQQLLDLLERSHPALVHEVVPKTISVQTLSDVLRRLLEEQISIRNLRDILQALAEWGPREKDPVLLAEYARMGLRRYLSSRYAHDDLSLRVLLLDPAIEQTVRESIQKTARGSYLALEPDLCHDIVEAVRAQLSTVDSDGKPPVILTAMEIRRYVRRLIEVELPDLPVLSYTELLPTVRIEPLARVTVRT